MSNTTKKFTTRQLTKAGFVRVPEMDFSDDGTNFKVFKYNGLYVTYTAWTDGKGVRELFIDVDPDRKNQYSFTYADYNDAEWKDLCGEFNGVPEDEVDVEKLVANCDIISKAVKELEEKVSKETIDIKALENIRKTEIAKVEDAIEYFKHNYNWFDASEWDLKGAKREVEFARRYIRQLNAHSLADLSFKQQREISQFYNREGWVDGWLRNYERNLRDYVAQD